MKKIMFFLLAFVSVTAFCQKTIVYDENVELRNLTGSFNSIRVSGGIDLYLTQSDSEQVAVSASKIEYRDKIITEINEGQLTIKYKSDVMRLGISMNKNSPKIIAYVSFKTLNRLYASGASTVIVTDAIKVPELNLDCSGASDFKGAIQADSLHITLSGASDATISGKSIKTEIRTSGASDVKAFELETEICSINTSGASDVSITVTKTLTAKASGASDINYKGNPAIQGINIGGSSSIRQRS